MNNHSEIVSTMKCQLSLSKRCEIILRMRPPLRLRYEGGRGFPLATLRMRNNYGNVLTERDHKESNSQDDGGMEGDVERVGEWEGEVIRVVKVCKRQPYHDSCYI